MLFVLLVEVLDHFVFVIDAFLYVLQIGRHLPEVLFRQPVLRGLALPRRGQDGLHCVRHDEVLRGFHPHHRFLAGLGHRFPFVGTVVGEVADGREGVVAHGSGMFPPEILRGSLAFMLEVAHGGAVAVLGVGLEAEGELT